MGSKKWTSAVHVIAGVFLGCLYHWYPGGSVAAFAGFGVYEWWEAKETGDTGHRDFWQGLLGYFIGLAIVFILKLTGVI